MAVSMACTTQSNRIIREMLTKLEVCNIAIIFMGPFGHLDAPLDPHGLCGEVGVSSSSIPVTGHWLGVERHHDTEVLRHPLEEVSADPEVVAHVDSLCGANLVLPLGGHH